MYFNILNIITYISKIVMINIKEISKLLLNSYYKYKRNIKVTIK